MRLTRASSRLFYFYVIVAMAWRRRGVLGFAHNPCLPSSPRGQWLDGHHNWCHSSRPRSGLAEKTIRLKSKLFMVDNLPSFAMALDTFDGSGIDPVIVSDAFWSTLSGKVASLFIGSMLATIIFSIAVSIAASQLSGIVERSSKGLVDKIPPPSRTELRMPPPGYSEENLAPIDLRKLIICVAIDILGSASELLPIVGDVTDVIYAPLAASLLRSLYGSNVVFLLEFGEEILPFTDIFPLATICWVIDTLAPSSGLARLLQLGDYGPGKPSQQALEGSNSQHEKEG